MCKLFNKILFEPTDGIIIQLFRYCIVGGIAFVVDNGSYWLLVSGGLHYTLSAIAGFVVGLIVNYLLSKFFVFKKESASTNAFFEFIIYGLIGVLGLLITEVLLWFFIEKLFMDKIVSKLVASVIVLIWNFVARKVILYR